MFLLLFRPHEMFPNELHSRMYTEDGTTKIMISMRNIDAKSCHRLQLCLERVEHLFQT